MRSLLVAIALAAAACSSGQAERPVGDCLAGDCPPEGSVRVPPALPAGPARPGVLPDRDVPRDRIGPPATAPRIDCGEGDVDVGEAAVGATAVATVRCVNVGDRAADALVATSDHPAFRMALPTGRILPGTSFDAEVRFAPTEAGEATAVFALRIADETLGEVRALGSGIVPPACDLRVAAILDFHRVALHEAATLDVELVNAGSEACVVSDLALAGTSPGFSLPGRASWLSVAPQQRVRLPVQFAPGSTGPTTATLTFQVAPSLEPRWAVDLRGTGVESCLVLAGGDRDFGVVVPGCASPEHRFVLRNTCAVPVGVQAIDATGAPFVLRSQPVLPTSIAPADRVEVGLAFAPAANARYAGGMLVRTTESPEPLLVSVAGTGDSTAVGLDTFTQGALPRVDLLVVVDTAPGAADLRQALEEGLARFLAYRTTVGIDYQVGVTTTDMDASGCGAGGVAAAGRLLPVDGSGPRIFTPHTPGFEAGLANAIPDGSCTQRRSAFDALARALELAQLADDPTTPRPGDGNLGFLREGAHLAVLLVTDGDDASLVWDAEPLVGALFASRGVDRYSVHAILPQQPCAGGSSGDRLLDLVETTGGRLADRCGGDLAAAVNDLALFAMGMPARLSLRGTPTDLDGDGSIDAADGEIAVRVNGRNVPPVNSRDQKVWEFDAALDAVVFSPFHLFVGGQVQVEYDAMCLAP